MACEAVRTPRQTAAERAREVRDALRALEAALAAGSVQVRLDARGRLRFQGWGEAARAGVNDACAFQALERSQSSALRRAVDREQGARGVKLDRRAIAAGTHTHDGGRTWGAH